MATVITNVMRIMNDTPSLYPCGAVVVRCPTAMVVTGVLVDVVVAVFAVAAVVAVVDVAAVVSCLITDMVVGIKR